MWGDDIYDSFVALRNCIINKRVLNSPDIGSCKVDAPVVAVGSGPSLERDLGDLNEIKDKVFIISSETAANKLIESGIVPDAVSPVERVETPGAMSGAESSWYLGAPYCPCAGNFCKYIMCAPNTGLSDWLGVKKHLVGSTSGTHAVLTGGIISRHRTYLIGHDLCFIGGRGHFKGHPKEYDGIRMQVVCNDGQQRESLRLWCRLAGEIALVAKKRSVRTASTMGQIINNVTVERLPSRFALRKSDKTLIVGMPVMAKADFDVKTRKLPHSFKSCVENVLSSSSMNDILLFSRDENADFFSTLYQSLSVQALVEMSLGKDEALCVISFQEAFFNSVESISLELESVL